MEIESMAGSRVWPKRVLLVSCSVLISALLVEGLLRLRQGLKYGTASTTVYRFGVDPDSGLRVPVANHDTGRIRINSRGFRSPEIAVPKPSSLVRIAFLGGSTTFCAEVSGNEATWPHLVWRGLQDSYSEVTWDYVNAGVPGYTLTECHITLKRRIKPLSPDVIIIYEATNDLSRDTRELARQMGLGPAQADQPSWLGNLSLTWFLLEKNWQIMMRQREATSTPRLQFDPRLSRGFHERLLRLVRDAQVTAPVVVLATFSHKIRRDQTPAQQLRAANTSLFYMPYMSVPGLLDAFQEYNRVIRMVAEDTGAVLVSDEEAIPGDDRHFNDSVHFTDAGAELMAGRVLKGLTASKALTKLLSEEKQGQMLSAVGPRL